MSLTYTTHALTYLLRIKAVQDAVNEELNTLMNEIDQLMGWNDTFKLNTMPQWQSMERTLDHIERTYVRL